MSWLQKNFTRVAAGVAFVGAYGFFPIGYPYHLMRREQQNLFVYAWDYIAQTYRGSGFLARFVADFLEQFFHLPVAGPVVVALLLTAIGLVTYRLCRHFLGRWPALAVAALLYAWCFLRETENQFITRYTLVVLGYLALALAALQFRKTWLKPVAAALFLAFGVWSLGTPYNYYHGRLWGYPILKYDRVIGLDTEVYRQNWDKVIRMSKHDLYLSEASYCYNLAHAMKGELGRYLFKHPQNVNSLLFWTSTEKSAFHGGLVGEPWYHMGNLTLAEQSAIISLQSSPKHTGVRYLRRLAEINLISGETAAADKYLTLLSKTLFYGRWARRMLSGALDEADAQWLEKARANAIRQDFVFSTTEFRPVLLELLEANPANNLAREYLLSYDLVRLDLDHFEEDYSQGMVKQPAYLEGIYFWLGMHELVTDENLARYGVDPAYVARMDRFIRNPLRFRDTFWYYCLAAAERE